MVNCIDLLAAGVTSALRIVEIATVSIVFIFSACPLMAQEPNRVSSEFRIVGYLPDYRPLDADAARQLTDLILFSAEPSASGELNMQRLSKIDWAELLQLKTQQRLRLILCVGGWERSKHFASVAGSPELRGKFVNSALQLCLNRRLDGIDIDWEHPHDAAEQTAYALLLRDLKAAFEPLGLTVSITMAAWQVVPRSAFDSVNWVQVMAYDHPERHSTLEGAQADVQKLIDAGAPVQKITLGLPFYGRGIADHNRTMTYQEIIAKHRPAAAIDEVDGVYFNGAETIARKTRYAKQSRLAGVMVWELGQDSPGEQSLLRVIRAAARE